MDATNLKTIVIPTPANSSPAFNWNTFRNNSVLQYIYIASDVYIKMSGGNGLSGTNNCPVYVPDELIDTYKTSDGWAQYASRIKGWSEFTA